LKYIVKRTAKPFAPDGKPSKDFWQGTETMELRNYMGQKPEHFPKTQIKLLYDEKFIYVFFHVEDRYIRAIQTNYNDSVCLDSCAEFFFTPCEDISSGYFNIEINCIGTMLFNHQIKGSKNPKVINLLDAEQIKMFTSLNSVIDPEIIKPLDWTLEYRVPINILKKYAKVAEPAPGVIWRANFYKCADETSHPHWLTWAPVQFPSPNFHMPEYFGALEFE
jgi:hypothetical protein